MFFVPLLGGLYWKRGNTTAAVLSMLGGLSTFVVTTQWLPEAALGMDPSVVSVLTSALLFVLGAYAGPGPREDVLIKFWGRNQDVQKVLARQHGSAVV
jgi:sodium/pantothenate symporter